MDGDLINYDVGYFFGVAVGGIASYLCGPLIPIVMGAAVCAVLVLRGFRKSPRP